jgi:hypothetical protein
MRTKDIVIIFNLFTIPVLHGKALAAKNIADEYTMLIGKYKNMLDVGEPQNQNQNLKVLDKLVELMNSIPPKAGFSKDELKLLSEIPPPPNKLSNDTTIDLQLAETYYEFLKTYDNSSLGHALLSHSEISSKIQNHKNLYTLQAEQLLQNRLAAVETPKDSPDIPSNHSSVLPKELLSQVRTAIKAFKPRNTTFSEKGEAR